MAQGFSATVLVLFLLFFSPWILSAATCDDLIVKAKYTRLSSQTGTFYVDLEIENLSGEKFYGGENTKITIIKPDVITPQYLPGQPKSLPEGFASWSFWDAVNYIEKRPSISPKPEEYMWYDHRRMKCSHLDGTWSMDGCWRFNEAGAQKLIEENVIIQSPDYFPPYYVAKSTLDFETVEGKEYPIVNVGTLKALNSKETTLVRGIQWLYAPTRDPTNFYGIFEGKVSCIPNPPPTDPPVCSIAAQVNNLNGEVIFTATANDKSGKKINSGIIDFGDLTGKQTFAEFESGDSKLGLLHTYSDRTKKYIATLNVEDSHGAEGICSREIAFSEMQFETCKIDYVINPPGSRTVDFYVTAYNPDGTFAKDVMILYDWHGPSESMNLASSNKITHTYPEGTANPQAIITALWLDGYVTGFCQTEVMLVNTPNNHPPACTITVTSQDNDSKSATFGFSLSDPDGDISQITIDWNDGKTNILDKTSTSAIHSFPDHAIYNPKITVVDSKNNSTECATEVNLTPPVAPESTIATCEISATEKTESPRSVKFNVTKIADAPPQAQFEIAVDDGKANVAVGKPNEEINLEGRFEGKNSFTATFYIYDREKNVVGTCNTPVDFTNPITCTVCTPVKSSNDLSIDLVLEKDLYTISEVDKVDYNVVITRHTTAIRDVQFEVKFSRAGESAITLVADTLPDAKITFGDPLKNSELKQFKLDISGIPSGTYIMSAKITTQANETLKSDNIDSEVFSLNIKRSSQAPEIGEIFLVLIALSLIFIIRRF